MGRPVMLSNGRMLVGLNKDGLVHDFYYPFVGLDNLTTSRSERHKIGIWADGTFSWVNDGTWHPSVMFDTDALISNISMRNESLGIELYFKDFVDPTYNVFCRRIEVKNLRDTDRDVRIFMHQVFQISHAGRADTALYEPELNYILDYKGRCSLLVYAQTDSGVPFDQYAVGNCGIEGKEGTFRDAEDGVLSGNAVEHGGVDSVVRLNTPVPANGARSVDYWVVAASNQQDAERIHLKIQSEGLEKRMNDCREWWHTWLSHSDNKLKTLETENNEQVLRSLLILKSHIDVRGSILASGDSSIFNYGRDYYCYCWPRDGAYVIWPLIRLGFKDEAKNFFEFCRDIIHDDGYLMHKYQADRAIGSTWHPLVHGNRKELAIQEDETAIVIIILSEYYKNTEDKEFIDKLYMTLIQPAANFMTEFIDDVTNLPHASYDLWEEKFLTSTYTVATTYAALKVAANFAKLFGHEDDAHHWLTAATRIESGMHLLFNEERQAFCKGFLLQDDGSLKYDNTLDVSSMYGMFMFGPPSMQEHTSSTVRLIEEVLMDKNQSGGAPRYENDTYMNKKPNNQGNPWFVTSLWMAQYYATTGNNDRAKEILKWTESKTLPSGVLSEQIDPDDSLQLSVSPLIWSHAEYLNTALDVYEPEE